MIELKEFPDNLDKTRFHFVGIKGTGMAALVEILVKEGAIITGSDVEEKFYTDEILKKYDIKPTTFDKFNITDKVEFVIYSAAYKLDTNVELIEAQKKHIPCFLYSQALGSLSKRYYSCGICGVHGKTTTTGLVGTLLKEMTFLNYHVLAGSIINSFGNSCTLSYPKDHKSVKHESSNLFDIKDSRIKIFVAETCEYKRHFMSFSPQKILLTSVESDHEDYYPTYESIRDAFVDYVCLLPECGQLIYCCDDKGASEVAQIVKQKRSDIDFVPYGKTATGDYQLTYINVEDGKNIFRIKKFNFDLAISMPGDHEVLDACGALALVIELLKISGEPDFEKFQDWYKNMLVPGLLRFSGGKRRSEVVGRCQTISENKVTVIDDYAHHPTAIKTTLEGYKQFYKGRKIILDFMSHTYSRTESLLDDFAKAVQVADVIILNKIYSSARENPKDFKINGKTLYQQALKFSEKGKKIVYFEEPLEAEGFVRDELEKPLSPEYPDGYLFVTMGAGDNWKLGEKVLNFYWDLVI